MSFSFLNFSLVTLAMAQPKPKATPSPPVAALGALAQGVAQVAAAKPPVASATLAHQVAQVASAKKVTEQTLTPSAATLLAFAVAPAPTKKNVPATGDQEERKKSLEERRNPSSKKAREDGQGKRRNKKKEEKLAKMRAASPILPPGIPVTFQQL